MAFGLPLSCRRLQPLVIDACVEVVRRHVRIDGRPAKIFMSNARCDGAPGTLIRAAITLADVSEASDYVDMNACIGRHAPAGDINAVETMIGTAKGEWVWTTCQTPFDDADDRTTTKPMIATATPTQIHTTELLRHVVS